MTAAWVDALQSREMTTYRQVLSLPTQPDVMASVLDDLKEYWAFDIEAWVEERTLETISRSDGERLGRVGAEVIGGALGRG